MDDMEMMLLIGGVAVGGYFLLRPKLPAQPVQYVYGQPPVVSAQPAPAAVAARVSSTVPVHGSGTVGSGNAGGTNKPGVAVNPWTNDSTGQVLTPYVPPPPAPGAYVPPAGSTIVQSGQPGARATTQYVPPAGSIIVPSGPAVAGATAAPAGGTIRSHQVAGGTSSAPKPAAKAASVLTNTAPPTGSMSRDHTTAGGGTSTPSSNAPVRAAAGSAAGARR